MAHSRDMAVAYATKFWNTVCHDKAVATKTNGKSSIVHPAASTGLADEDDCTHFVSCCIGSQGGGLLLGTWEMPPAYGVLSPQSLIDRLKQKGFGTPSSSRVLPTAAASAVAALSPGDVIAYYTNGNPSIGTPPGYFHAVLYMGNGLITCHTVPRFKLAFTVIPFDSLTTLQITV